jgi:hypothetical protein
VRLFLCCFCAHLVLRILDFNDVDVTLKNAERLGRCCQGKVDLLVATGGVAEVLPVSPSCPCHS